MRCPFAVWRGSPNVGGTPVRPARGLVVHVEVGTESGTNSCFQNPSFKASAHFGCAKDGSLDQWVDTDQVAWAEVAGNPGWISVETEGTPDEPLTQAQITCIARLLVWLQGLYKFPFQTCDHDGTGLTTHAHYPSGIPDPQFGGHSCPGTIRSAQLPAILAAAKPSPTAVPSFLEELLEMAVSDPGFAVRFLYRFCLHREADPNGYTAWVSAINKGASLDAVMATFQDSDEGKAAIVAERKALGLS